MRSSCACFLIFIFVGAADARIVETIDITEVGIFETAAEKTVGDFRSVAGFVDEVARPKLVRATATIPAAIGTSFGFDYRVIGARGATAKLKAVMRIPPPGIRNPEKRETTVTDVSHWDCKVGGTCYIGYTFGYAWEIIPGTWTIELWEGNRMLASQSFEIINNL